MRPAMAVEQWVRITRLAEEESEAEEPMAQDEEVAAIASRETDENAAVENMESGRWGIEDHEEAESDQVRMAVGAY